MSTSFGWEGKGRYGSVSGCTRCVQVKLWVPLRTPAIPERLSGVITIRLYTNPRLPLPLPLSFSHILYFASSAADEKHRKKHTHTKCNVNTHMHTRTHTHTHAHKTTIHQSALLTHHKYNLCFLSTVRVALNNRHHEEAILTSLVWARSKGKSKVK